MSYINVILILLIALAITAGLLIFFIVILYHDREDLRTSSDVVLARVLGRFPLPVFAVNKKHHVIQWNKALEVLSGISKEEVMGTNNQWKAFYGKERPVLADLIADGASEEEISARYHGSARKSALIRGAYEAEDFFPSLGENGKWYHFTASPLVSRGRVIGAIEILEDVTERHIAEQNLRYYARQITRVQEEERKYIARELHDTTVQTLVALIYQMDNFRSGKPDLTNAEKVKLDAIYQRMKSAVEEVRRFSRQLRPPVLDDLGLLPVLEWLKGELKKMYDMEVEINATGKQKRLQPDTELALFRIIQEALINAAKHAKVSSATVLIEYLEHNIKVSMIDRGVGFDLAGKIDLLPRDGKLGLAGIVERVQMLGGKVDIDSVRGRGTIINVEIPV
ncbi:MAG: histidine kinase [Dehalococcoidia bacterium]|nr:histidine kinase [Dehalococcoidia bacterium]MDD5647711.1 histidine kinase [Dehalococcoidia bacterium]